MIWEDGNPYPPSSSCSALGASSSKASGWPGTSIPTYTVALVVLFLGHFLIPGNVGLGQGSFLGAGVSGWASEPLVQALTPPSNPSFLPQALKWRGLLQATQPGRPEAAPTEGATGRTLRILCRQVRGQPSLLSLLLQLPRPQ